MSADPILAIDFGTSNSLVGAITDNVKHAALPIDPLASDPTMMRTLLYFPHADRCFYGAEALTKFIDEDMEGRLFRSFKSHLPNPSYLGTVIGNRILSLENMVGTFLLELKKRAEKNLGDTVERVVLGRPARYSMDPVQDGIAVTRMTKAAQFAGFKDVHFVPEPLAAAFDYRKSMTGEKIILIGDFGGGTSDFTLARLRPDRFQMDDVLSVEGCPLAGDALDSVFMSERLNQYFGAKSVYRLPMSSNILSMPPLVTQRLNHPAHIVHLKDKETYEFIKEVQRCALREEDQEAIERLFLLIEDQQIFPFFESIESLKKALSKSVDFKFEFSYPGIKISETFSQKQFIEWALSPKEKIFAALDRCFTVGGVKPEDVDFICLTGGTAQVPFIRQEFERRFGQERLQTASHFHSVLSGLVESAALLNTGDLKI